MDGDSNSASEVSFTMKQINETTDSIYESMMDVDREELAESIERLRSILDDVESSYLV